MIKKNKPQLFQNSLEHLHTSWSWDDLFCRRDSCQQISITAQKMRRSQLFSPGLTQTVCVSRVVSTGWLCESIGNQIILLTCPFRRVLAKLSARLTVLDWAVFNPLSALQVITQLEKSLRLRELNCLHMRTHEESLMVPSVLKVCLPAPLLCWSIIDEIWSGLKKVDISLSHREAVRGNTPAELHLTFPLYVKEKKTCQVELSVSLLPPSHTHIFLYFNSIG